MSVWCLFSIIAKEVPFLFDTLMFGRDGRKVSTAVGFGIVGCGKTEKLHCQHAGANSLASPWPFKTGGQERGCVEGTRLAGDVH